METESVSDIWQKYIRSREMARANKNATDPKLDKPTDTMYHDNKLEGNKPMNGPGLETRFSALERRQFNLEVRVEELDRDMTAGIKQLSEDMTAGTKQVSRYLSKIEDEINDRFDKVDERFDGIETDIASMKGDITTLKGDMVEVKGDIATLKGDMVGVKGDITTMKEDITMLKRDMVEVKGDITDIKSTMKKSHEETVQALIQILDRLPRGKQES